MFSALRRFRDARRELHEYYAPKQNFSALEESCIPSYTHSNPVLGWVAWQRLVAAAGLWEKFGPGSKVLDFGAGSGALCSLLPSTANYFFCEANDHLATKLSKRYPHATRFSLGDCDQSFDAIFALDSLEHNHDVDDLLSLISMILRPGGLFVLSGPTENFIYRCGRRLAGYTGDYHHTTVYHIEKIACRYFEREELRTVPFGIPLFRLSSWRHK